MRLHQALDNEKVREEKDSWNKVFIHKDGKFFHIYDWSAWLVKTIVCTEEFQKERGDAKMLTASRYKTKEAEYAIIGFPIESLSKYIPDYEDYENIDENTLAISVNLPELPEDMTFEQLSEQMEEWKQSLELKEGSQKSRRQVVSGEGQAAALGRSGLFAIASQILSYPVENHSYLENTQFLLEIKKQLEVATGTLSKMRTHRISQESLHTWDDVIDIDFLIWLSGEIILLDPRKGCNIVGTVEDWEGLDHSKSMFYTPDGLGLPIGNLTSQLLSNVYLNVFDQYVKRLLKCKHYGRYVDDSYIVNCCKSLLLSLVPQIRGFPA